MRSYHRSKYSKQSDGFKSSGVLFDELARESAARNGISKHQILSSWEEVVGEDLASICRPERVSHARLGSGGAKLVLKAPKGFVQQVEMQRDQIIERVNTAFGFGAVRGIRIEHTTYKEFVEPEPSRVRKKPTSAQEKHVRDLVKDIDNGELRELLYELGLNVVANNREKESDDENVSPPKTP